MNDAVQELTDVFEANICNPDVDYYRCFNNFTDVLIEIQKLDLEDNKKYDKLVLTEFLTWGTEMLRVKYIDPKGITGMTFVNWKKDHSRVDIWK